MRPYALWSVALAAAVWLPHRAAEQSRTVYAATGDTLRYAAANTYILYFVSERDTVGEPITTHAVELHHLAAAGPGRLTDWVRVQFDDPEPSASERMYTIMPSGRVVAIDGRPAAEVATARVGLLPHLADPPVLWRVGQQWTDTVTHEYEAGYGRDHFSASRRYRVDRIDDSLGTRIARVVAQGTMQLRHGGWQDSTEGTVWWQDVAGRVVDTVWFDVVRGELVADVTIIDLSGTGGAGPKGGGMSLPGGLRSESRRRRLPPR